MPGNNKWSKKPPSTKGLPSPKELMDAKKAPKLNTKPMTMDEKIRAVDEYAKTRDVGMVAASLNRSEDSMRRFLQRYQSTSAGARLTLEAGAEKLAKRIIKDANVEESLEVMDRLDILSKKADKAPPVSSFSIIVGMPSTSAPRTALDVVPVPTQAQIEEAKHAIDAEVVSGKDVT